MLGNVRRCLIAAAAVIGLAGTVVISPTSAATGSRNRQPCPLILTDGGVLCYSPRHVATVEKHTPIRGFDPGRQVWRETKRRLTSIEAVIGVTPPYPPSETNKTVQIFFNSGHRPNTPVEPCSHRPKFVVVSATVRQYRNRGRRVTWRQGCWEMTANWTRKHVSMAVESNYPRGVLVRTALAVFIAGQRHGL